MQRWSYYGISATPIVRIDGIVEERGGISQPGTMWPFYYHDYQTRSAISSPFTVDLTCNYDSVANSGVVTATITNTTGSNRSGTLHFAIIENAIPYNWGGLTTVEHVCRDMLPTASGEAVTVPAMDTIMRSRSFTISGAWDEHNCNIVTFVQGATREIYQGGEIAVMEATDMHYYGLTFTELSGTINQFAQPGETIRMYVNGKNYGSGTYAGGASIISSDPYITIISSNPQAVSITAGESDTVISLDVDIDVGCPSPHEWDFQLDFGDGSVSDIKFIVTNEPGFEDDIESGVGGWTLEGASNYWHIQSYRSHSPSNSWYCGNDISHTYSDRNVASLVSPYFVVTPDSSLSFWHWYSLETSWDYSYLEIDNNSGWWQTVDEFNGNQMSWNQATYPLSAYSGQTVRLRFRFLSDQSVQAEGWYIDDVIVPIIIFGSDETNDMLLPITLQVSPNPFTKHAEIRWQITDDRSRITDNSTKMKIYNATGQLVRQWDDQTIRLSDRISWQGDDDSGQRLPAGIYFVRLENDDNILTEKVLLLK